MKDDDHQYLERLAEYSFKRSFAHPLPMYAVVEEKLRALTLLGNLSRADS
jgi:hypothetical protein